jgi:hypothetical protein
MSAIGTARANSSILMLLEKFGAGRENSPVISAKAGQGAEDFLSSLKVRLAEIRSQTFEALLSQASASPGENNSTNFAVMFGQGNAAAKPFDDQGAASTPTGRNLALFDPESAYNMMTAINARDVTYKAEFSEMSQMKSYLSTLRQEGQSLGNIDAAASNTDIQARLQSFADAYNGWITRFDKDLQPGGLLAGTYAAQVSQWELEQSIENFFNGAVGGMHGMRDVGFTIDSISNLASVSDVQLNSILETNKAGAVLTMREFSTNFAKSVELLNSDANFISGRLNNLSRVIDYIGVNKPSLQAEFGLGDPATPSRQVAQALSSYSGIQGLIR